MNLQTQTRQAPASASFGQAGVTPCESPLSESVGQPLTDESREEAIQRAARAMEAHYFRWCCTGNFADKGDADRARVLMEALIRGRSKAQVLRMEIRKGLI